jgi:dipeptidyl-peptidase 4
MPPWRGSRLARACGNLRGVSPAQLASRGFLLVALPLAVLIALGSAPGRAAAQGPGAVPPHPGFLRAFAETRAFLLGRPTKIQPTPDGRAVLFLRTPPRQPNLALFELDLASGKSRELVTPAALLGGAEEKLSTEEKARRERLRIVDRGFTSYELSEDGRRVLLPLSGRLYVYEREGTEAGKTRVIGTAAADAPAVLDPHFSPDGSKVAYVRGFDLHLADVASGRERRLTRGGSADLTHGMAEFIAQEEMGRHEGFFWSPDSRRLAYTEVDQRGLERFSIGDATHPEIPASVFPYPRPGKANVKVRLGLISAAGGATTWVKWDSARYPYLARVIWKEKGAPLTLLVQTRDQREAALLAVDPGSGATRVLLVDRDDAWVELDDDLPRWLPGGKGLLAVSDSSGRRVLSLHRADGTVDRPLMEERFHRLVHVSDDARKVYALTATPTSSRIWEVSLEGKTAPVALTGDEAEHLPVFAKRAALFVDTRAAANALPTSSVYRQSEDGGSWTKIADLPQVAENPPFRVNLALSTVELPGVPAPFQVALIRPRGFRRDQRYPVIVSVYGGPSVATVRSDERYYLLHQWLADHGAVVVCIDNRGTPRRDRAWSRSIKGSFGKIPLDDQAAVLKALGTRHPELDLAKVGIYGWSFGGYMSALAVMKRPDLFKAAVAGAPVVDWLDYDTHYTERYLDLPAANPKGYQDSSLLTHAPGLARPLLLIHGTTDDNVYFFHSLKLANALFRAGKPFDFLPLTVTHQVPDAVVREQLWNRIAQFLIQHLR